MSLEIHDQQLSQIKKLRSCLPINIHMFRHLVQVFLGVLMKASQFTIRDHRNAIDSEREDRRTRRRRRGENNRQCLRNHNLIGDLRVHVNRRQKTTLSRMCVYPTQCQQVVFVLKKDEFFFPLGDTGVGRTNLFGDQNMCDKQFILF